MRPMGACFARWQSVQLIKIEENMFVFLRRRHRSDLPVILF